MATTKTVAVAENSRPGTADWVISNLGAADEIVPAFSVHAASAHGQILDEDLAGRLASDAWLSPQSARVMLAALGGPAGPPPEVSPCPAAGAPG